MFSECFDKSLFLILESDKNNRDQIVNFVCSIPIELLNLINHNLEIYQDYFTGKRNIFDDNCVFCLSDNILIDNNIMYSFVIDMVEDSITIKKNIYDGNNFNNEFELVLYAETTYNSIRTVGEQRLGFFKYYGDVFNYNLINTIFGMIVMCSNKKFLSKYKRITIQDLSDNKIDDFFNKGNNVRVRKRFY